jgi:hypothetical protein
MGTGEHYFVDLVVAAPFTLFLYAIFCAEISWCDHKRWAAILGGMAMVVVTVIGTLWLKRSLSAISVDAGCEEHEAPIADVPAEGPESVGPTDVESIATRLSGCLSAKTSPRAFD